MYLFKRSDVCSFVDTNRASEYMGGVITLPAEDRLCH